MMFRMGLIILAGFSYGLLAAAGVFTVLVAVGLIPRFAGKTHTSKYVVLYEDMVVAGTIAGGIFSVFSDGWDMEAAFGAMGKLSPMLPQVWTAVGGILLVVFGLFCGMFIGCLALAIAEMLDSIPIFTRRIALRHGIGLAILSMAAGKVAGSLFYFINEFHRTVS